VADANSLRISHQNKEQTHGSVCRAPEGGDGGGQVIGRRFTRNSCQARAFSHWLFLEKDFR
jgi:hypothetical protein